MITLSVSSNYTNIYTERLPIHRFTSPTWLLWRYVITLFWRVWRKTGNNESLYNSLRRSAQAAEQRRHEVDFLPFAVNVFVYNLSIWLFFSSELSYRT